MKRAIGAVLIGLGLMAVITSALNGPKAPTVSYLVGTFLPGVFLMLCGALLRRNAEQASHLNGEARAAENVEKLEAKRTGSAANRFKSICNTAIVSGFVTMLFGGAVSGQGPDIFLVGSAILAVGWAIFIWGCVNYARWKGYSGWGGLLGYLLLPGLIILACLPNKRKASVRENVQQCFGDRSASLSAIDSRSNYRFALILLPLAALLCVVGANVASIGSNLDSAGWRPVNSTANGFQAIMPGIAQEERRIEETPAGNVEICKYTVMPKEKKELFMIVCVSFPDDALAELGGPAQLLELGREDLLDACEGRIQSERPILLDGNQGLELEVLPKGGAIVKSRIFATSNQIYQVSAHVPQFRLSSNDVQKFLDSFRLPAKSMTPAR